MHDDGPAGHDTRASPCRVERNGGNTDVVYTLQGKPEVRSLAPGLATSTIFMKSTRSTASGTTKEGSFAVSAIWKRFPEGWRVIYSHESTSR